MVSLPEIGVAQPGFQLQGGFLLDAGHRTRLVEDGFDSFADLAGPSFFTTCSPRKTDGAKWRGKPEQLTRMSHDLFNVVTVLDLTGKDQFISWLVHGVVISQFNTVRLKSRIRHCGQRGNASITYVFVRFGENLIPSWWNLCRCGWHPQRFIKNESATTMTHGVPPGIRTSGVLCPQCSDRPQ